MSIAFENESDKEFKCVDSLDEIEVPSEILEQLAELFYELWKRDNSKHAE